MDVKNIWTGPSGRAIEQFLKVASPTLNFNINQFGFLFTECLSDFSFNDIYLESNYLKYIWWFKNPTVLFLYNWRFHLIIISRADITHSKYIKTFFTSFVELNKTWQSTKISGNCPDQTVSFYSTTEHFMIIQNYTAGFVFRLNFICQLPGNCTRDCLTQQVLP